MADDLPPEWAIKEALDRADRFDWTLEEVLASPTCFTPRTILAFARMIAKHEPAPVDPVEAAVERAMARWRKGDFRLDGAVRAGVLAGISIAEGRAK